MYTVKELIDALMQCPQDATVFSCGIGAYAEKEVNIVAIDPFDNVVTLFTD